MELNHSIHTASGCIQRGEMPDRERHTWLQLRVATLLMDVTRVPAHGLHTATVRAGVNLTKSGLSKHARTGLGRYARAGAIQWGFK